jgi:hypothetical protein
MTSRPRQWLLRRFRPARALPSVEKSFADAVQAWWTDSGPRIKDRHRLDVLRLLGPTQRVGGTEMSVTSTNGSDLVSLTLTTNQGAHSVRAAFGLVGLAAPTTPWPPQSEWWDGLTEQCSR